MSDSNRTRWQQKLERFSKALSQLDRACQKDSYTDLEFLGFMQVFLATQEMGWQAIGALLIYCGQDPRSWEARNVISKAFEEKHLSEKDAILFIKGLGLERVYDGDVARKTEAFIKQEYLPLLHRLHARCT